MPTFTKAAIKATFISLLNKKPLNKITVKEIVEECGINRNSFYYHFDDIPSLLEEILVEEADRFVATETDSNTSVYESLISVIDYAFSNKSVIQHIYNSANRTTFDVYLNRICTHAIKSYFDKLEITKNIAEDDLDAMIMYYKCLLYKGKQHVPLVRDGNEQNRVCGVLGICMDPKLGSGSPCSWRYL